MKQWSATGGDIQWGRSVSEGKALVQRHEHMLDTAPGELGSDVEWGIGARAYQGRTTAEVDTKGLAATWRAQHLRDPETEDVEGVIAFANSRLEYDATIIAKSGVQVPLEAVIE